MENSPRRILAAMVLLGVWATALPARAAWPFPDHDPNATRHAEGSGQMTGEGVHVPGVAWSQDLLSYMPDQGTRLADIDGDGEAELLIVVQFRIQAYELDGTLKWETPPVGVREIYGVYDFDADGSAEILASAYAASAYLWIFSGQTGALLWQHAAATPGQGFGEEETLVGNIDADASLELLWSSLGYPSPDLDLADFGDNLFHPTVIAGSIAGYSNATYLMEGDLAGDGNVYVVFFSWRDLVLRNLTSKDPADVLSYTNLLPGGNFGPQYLVDVDQDGQLEVVFTGGFWEQGIGVADPVGVVPDPDNPPRLWACQLGGQNGERPDSGLWYAPALDTLTPNTPPADLDGDGTPEFALGLRGSFDFELWQDPQNPHYLPPENSPYRPDFNCPDAELISPSVGAGTIHVFDLLTGQIKALLPDVEPWATLDLDGDGIAELIGKWIDPTNPGNWRFSIYRLQDGELVLLDSFAPGMAPAFASRFPRPSDWYRRNNLALLTADTNGDGRIEMLSRSETGGVAWIAWVQLEDDQLITVREDTTVGTPPLAWWVGDNGQIRILRGLPYDVVDEQFNILATFDSTTIQRKSGWFWNDQGNEYLRAGNWDPDDQTDELAVAATYNSYMWTRIYDVRPEQPTPLSLRFDSWPTLTRHSFLTQPAPGELPLLIAVSADWDSTASHVSAFDSAGNEIWRFAPCPEPGGDCPFPARVVTYAVPGHFTDAQHTDVAVVLDPEDCNDPNNSENSVIFGLHWDGTTLTRSSPQEFERPWQTTFNTNLKYYSTGLLVEDLGSPDAWGVPDGREDVMVLHRNRSWTTQFSEYLDLNSGQALAPRAVLATASFNYAGLADFDADGKGELGLFASYMSASPIPHQMVQPAPDWFGQTGYSQDASVPAAWSFPMPFSSLNWDTYTILDADGDGGQDMAKINGAGGLYVLDGATGDLLPGYPVFLSSGQLHPAQPSGQRQELALTNFSYRQARAVISVDIDGDDQAELLAGSDDGWVYAIRFDAEHLPQLLWSMYLGVGVRQMLPSDWNGDGSQELIVYGIDGKVYGIRPGSVYLSITDPEVVPCLCSQQLALQGDVGGADEIEISLNGSAALDLDIEIVGDHWTAEAFALPNGTSEVVVVGLSDGHVVATDARLYTSLPDCDGDRVLNDEDCNCLDADIYQGAPELCDGKDNDCDGQAQDSVPCDDGLACTVDSCGATAGCRHVLSAGHCLIAAACYAGGALNPDGCQYCAPAVSTTDWTAKDDGDFCLDDDVCNGDETCQQGECTDGTPRPHNGDVTADLSLSAGDAQLAFLIGLGTYFPNDDEQCAADCNGDAEVTAGDAQQIFFFALGIGDACVDPLD